MVTVNKRPDGHKLIDQGISATITDAGDGDALVNFTSHGLVTGDVVYVESDIDEYNGFWYVTLINANSFKISDWSSDQVDYYQDADITYYQTQEHDWASIFLPMVYKLTNNRWPINTSDPQRLVSSQADDNGFTNLTISGSLRFSVVQLEFVEISNSLQSGVYQIVEVISPTNITINLPYDSTNDIPGATIQYYYNNYQLNVKVYAGLPTSHPWESKKPFEEMAELSLTPDEVNEVMFSVSDYIKSKVSVKNNLTLFSLPLNLDAFTGYYIAVGESYDYSDGYTLGTTQVLYTDDTFEGYAIAGKLPFKNVYSGDYAEYVYTSGSPAKWLTNMERPVAVEDLYFDISFIKNVIGTFNLIIDKYVTDYLTQTIVIPYADQGIGVYRLPITPDANYDSFCIRVRTDSYIETVEVFPADDDLSVYTQTSGAGFDWVITDVLTVNMTDDQISEHVGRNLAVLSGNDLIVNYDITLSYTNTLPLPRYSEIYFFLNDTPASNDDLEILQIDIPTVGSGTINTSGTITITASSNRARFEIVALSGPDEQVVVINSFSFGEPTTEEVTVDGETVTEEICIDMQAQCDITDGITQEDRRLLEDGDYRLLE